MTEKGSGCYVKSKDDERMRRAYEDIFKRLREKKKEEEEEERRKKK